MHDYDFILRFRLDDPAADADDLLAALVEAGCDDATVGIGQRGRIALDFTRTAPDGLAAIASAVRDVQAAIPGAELVEASPDFVGLSDVAELMGCSRQNIRKLVVGNAATFPAAVHEGTQSLWHLRPVLAWFADHQKRQVDPSLLDIAGAAMQVNIARDARRVPGAALPPALEALFA